jgi:hypothetical protein
MLYSSSSLKEKRVLWTAILWHPSQVYRFVHPMAGPMDFAYPWRIEAYFRDPRTKSFEALTYPVSSRAKSEIEK